VSLISSGIASSVGLVPAFLAVSGARKIHPPSRKLSTKEEALFLLASALLFWAIFSALSGFNVFKIDESFAATDRYTMIWALASTAITFVVLTLLGRLAKKGPKALKDRFENAEVPAGDRSPWLVSMDWVDNGNSVLVWTKSGVVYGGTVFVAPETETDDSIVLKVTHKASRDQESPHKTTPLESVNTGGVPKYVTIFKGEIAAMETFDHATARRRASKLPVPASETSTERSDALKASLANLNGRPPSN